MPPAARHPSSVPVTVVRSAGALDELAGAVAAAVGLAIDTETHVASGAMRVLSAATRDAAGEERAWVVDVRDVDAVALAPLLAGRRAAAWNAGFDAAVLDSAVFDPAGTPVRNRLCWWDAMFADALLHQGRRGATWYHGLAWAVERYLGFSAEGKGTTQLSYDRHGDLSEVQIAYAAADAVETLWVADVLAARLRDEGLETAAALEMAARPFLDAMRRHGFPFDVAGYERFLDDTAAQLRDGLSELAELTGGGQQNLFDPCLEPSWNPASDGQAKAALNRFAADEVAAALERRGEGRRLLAPWDALDAATLRDIGGPLARALLSHRHHAKLLSTYGRSFLDLVGPDGRVHSHYVQIVGSSTGRLASRFPNAQNLAPEAARHVRARPGRVLVSADLSQAELRWAAQVSGDGALREAFAAGRDVHAATAEGMFGVDMAALAVSDAVRHGELRARAKTINFGILYGQGPRALARGLTAGGQPTDLAAAQALLEQYRATYPRLDRWLADRDAVIAELAHRPPPVDWAATLRLLDGWAVLTAARRALRQRVERRPTAEEVTGELAGSGLSDDDLRWLAGFEDPVVLTAAGGPLCWESRTLSGRRSWFEVGTWGVLRSAALRLCRRTDEAWVVRRDELAEAFGLRLRTAEGPLSDAAAQRVLDNRELRRALITEALACFGEPAVLRLLDGALTERVTLLGNAYRNAPIQGGVADAMLDAFARLWDRFAEDPDVWPTQTVHDSVVLECPEARAGEVGDALVAAMTAAFARFCPDVPVAVDVTVR